MTKQKDRIEQSGGWQRALIAPLVAFSVLVVAVLTLALAGLVRSFDNESVLREQQLVANGFGGSTIETGAIVQPQAVWGDAVHHLDNSFDPDWAQTYVLTYLSEMTGFTEIFVLDSQNRFLIGQSDGKRAGSERMAEFARAAPGLIAAVRSAESIRNREGRFSKAPIQANAVAAIGEKVFIVSATRVQPDDPGVRLRGQHGPIILTGLPIGPAFLQRFGKRFLLTDLRLLPIGAPRPDGYATTALSGAHGEEVAQLVWKPQTPARSLVERMTPTTLAVAGVLLIMAIRSIRHSHRVSHGLIASEARSAHLAYHDSLTGLPNRVQFGDRLSKALGRLRRGSKPLAVFCVDLDRFKNINDAYGHAVGDELLRQVAQRMADQCRDADVIARLSGDEFAIAGNVKSPGEAAALANRLCKAIAEPFDCGVQLRIGCSVGVALTRDGAIDSAEVLRQADIALYRAKEKGRGQACLFESELDIAIKNRRELENELRNALENEGLAMHYQPQVDTRGKITGLEALVRWHHPVRGQISPTLFVSVAEQSGLILDLGLFALRKAFNDSKRWPGLRIAVNISANQIRDKNFLGNLSKLVRETRVDPRNFDLEITEGILLGDDPDTQARLAELNRMGFGLALDDFGTGYSSLSYLHRYPIDKIKIDRSFIANLGVEGEADAVVDAIVKLAQALGLGVIAEGVETAAQFNHLKATGGIELQGFLFSRPISAEQIDGLMGTMLAPQSGSANKLAAA